MCSCLRPVLLLSYQALIVTRRVLSVCAHNNVDVDKGTRARCAHKNRTVNNCGYLSRGASAVTDTVAFHPARHARLAGKQTALHKPPVAIRSCHYLLTFRIYRRTGALAKLVCLELSFDARPRVRPRPAASKLLRH